MPKTTKTGKVKTDELPSTLQRSGHKAQDTFAQTYDSAIESYDGDEAAAHRVAFASLKHTHEKVGDHWEPKDEYGPSDEQSERGSVDTDLPTAGGVDANATRKHLYELAQRLGVEGRSTMSKDQLVEALQKANQRSSAKALDKDRAQSAKKVKKAEAGPKAGRAAAAKGREAVKGKKAKAERARTTKGKKATGQKPKPGKKATGTKATGTKAGTKAKAGKSTKRG